MKTITKIVYPALALLALDCFALLQRAQAVVPAPDGGYPGGNTAEGQAALLSLTTGGFNTAVGFLSLRSDTTSSFNTAIGAGTLVANTADNNTATGAAALLFNTTGFNNTAVGATALLNNTEGENNTATGFQTLRNNTTGGDNTATGRSALFSNTTGGINTANGVDALFSNTTGIANTATGDLALLSNTTGDANTANGASALRANIFGDNNTAIGTSALFSNTAGAFNTAVGVEALFSNTIGNNNTALGFSAGLNQTTGGNNVYIGAGISGVAGESDACYIGSIFGQTSASGTPVLINSSNKLGTTTSSKRFKEEIKPMDKASKALLALKPVTFRYKKEIDPAGTSQFGLVAEEVEKVNPDLVMRDQEGKPYSVRYDQVNAMLLNEFLKEHRKNERQEATIMRLEKQIEALTAGLEKVSAQLELSKPAPQTVFNSR
jgi:trimeric autotransporter adhesin